LERNSPRGRANFFPCPLSMHRKISKFEFFQLRILGASAVSFFCLKLKSDVFSKPMAVRGSKGRCERVANLCQKSRALCFASRFGKRLRKHFEPTQDVAGEFCWSRNKLHIVDRKSRARQYLCVFLDRRIIPGVD